MICQNQIRCLKCGDEPYSASRHDLKYCKCGTVAVDGGMDYLRRVGNMLAYKDLSYSMDDGIVRECLEEMRKMQKDKRNDLGVLLGVFRVLNNYQRLITDRQKGV